MSLITRYLLRQFLGPLFVCLISFNGIFILFDLFGHLSRFLDADLPLADVLRYYAGVVCMYSHWFLPASCMLATLYTMWQLSHHSELTAMRASGISFHLLTLPFFCVAFAMSLLTLADAELLAPSLSAWSDALKSNKFAKVSAVATSNHVFMATSANRTWRIASADLSSPEAMSRLEGPVEIRRRNRSTGFDEWGVRAARADFLDGAWWLTGAEPILFDQNSGEEILPDPANPPPRPPAFFCYPELSETPADMFLADRIDKGGWDFLSARDMLRVLRTEADGREAEGKDSGDRHDTGRWFDFWYRLASPWSCIVITLFSIPTGITTGRQSVFKGIVLALATFFAFYAASLALEFCGQNGLLPPAVAAWAPNVLFLGIGLFLYRRLT